MNLIILGSLIAVSLALPTFKVSNNSNQLGLARRGNSIVFGDHGGNILDQSSNIAVSVAGKSLFSGANNSFSSSSGTLDSDTSMVDRRRRLIANAIGIAGNGNNNNDSSSSITTSAQGNQMLSGNGINVANISTVGDTINNFSTNVKDKD